MLEFKNVSKHFGSIEALNNISLKIENGEFVIITGPSGSGKSTMMHIIGVLDRPSQGDIFLKNRSISTRSKSELAILRGKTIGFIFQQFNLFPTLSALENVALPMEIINESEDDALKRAEKLLVMLGLGDRMHHKPTELSGGQQQRVAIARALSNNPEVILADEPTGNLDSKTGAFVMDFLGKLHKEEGKTVILITHDLNLVKYAKRIIHIKDGSIIKDTKEEKK